MPDESNQALTCISCGNAEERSSMVNVRLEHAAQGWPKNVLLCRSCVFAVTARAACEEFTREVIAVDAGEAIAPEAAPAPAQCYISGCFRPSTKFCQKHNEPCCTRHYKMHAHCEAAGNDAPTPSDTEGSAN